MRREEEKKKRKEKMQKGSVIAEVPSDSVADLGACEHPVRHPEILGERTY